MDSQKEQFSRIYQDYIDKIYRFVYLKVNSQETAEDITSKVFLKGWEAFKGAKEEIKNPSAFLYQIARNAVVDYYRANARAKTVSLSEVAEAPDSGKDSHEKAIANADIEQIKVAILGLKKDYQDIILFHYIDDMDINEIAQLVGKPAGTVRVMLHRGLKDLKDIIQES